MLGPTKRIVPIRVTEITHILGGNLLNITVGSHNTPATKGDMERISNLMVDFFSHNLYTNIPEKEGDIPPHVLIIPHTLKVDLKPANYLSTLAEKLSTTTP